MKTFKKIIYYIFFFLGFSQVTWAQSNSDTRNQEIYKRFQEMRNRIMNDFFSESDSFMKDIDHNLFKSFGFGADLSGNLFNSRWQDEKDGKSFLITPQKNAELKIVVNNGFISIDASEKNQNGITSSKVSLNVPEGLDWKKHQIKQMGEDIVVTFPYFPGMQTPQKMNINNEKKVKDSEATVPIIPENFDASDVI